jgi:hypothetical protein
LPFAIGLTAINTSHKLTTKRPTLGFTKTDIPAQISITPAIIIKVAALKGSIEANQQPGAGCCG